VYNVDEYDALKGDTRVIAIPCAVVPFFLADSENEKVLFKATTIFFSSAKPVSFISRRYLFDRDTISVLLSS